MMITEHWDMIPYGLAWQRQTELFNRMIADKLSGKTVTNRLIFCEHPHVYTLGKHGNSNNLLVNENQLKQCGAQLYHIDRGGDITYHGPGQLVCYPILDLDSLHLGVKEYVYRLEQAVIDVCGAYGVSCQRLNGATGVWIDVGSPLERKICAIGIRCSHFVSMHGLALNVNTDLSFFQRINPCGFIGKGVTSLSRECRRMIPMTDVVSLLDSALRHSLLS